MSSICVRAADELRAAAGEVDGHASGGVGPEQRFLDCAAGRTSGPHWRGSSLSARALESLLDVMGQGEVEVVAAEDQVLADGDAVEERPFAAGLAAVRSAGRGSA